MLELTRQKKTEHKGHWAARSTQQPPNGTVNSLHRHGNWEQRERIINVQTGNWI